MLNRILVNMKILFQMQKMTGLLNIPQPPNSPHLNVLDFGVFNSIQSQQHQASPATIDKLIKCVEDAYNELSRDTLNKLLFTLQTCMESIMLVDGDNSYKIRHINKDQLIREKRLPSTLRCLPFALRNAKNQLE